MWQHTATVCTFTMEAGESSMACYQSTAAIHIVIKLESPLRRSPSRLPSILLYLCSCLFFCITVLLLDAISIIEIISVLLSLSLETVLCALFSPPLSSVFHAGSITIIWCLGPSVVFAGVFIALLVSLLFSPLNLWFCGNGVDLLLPVMFMFVFVYTLWVSRKTVQERKIMISLNVLGLCMHVSVWQVISQNAFEYSHSATDNIMRLYINLLKA